MDSMEMKVNRLPAPTWNWLRMNGTETAARVGGEGAFDFEIPASRAKRCPRRRWTALPAWGRTWNGW